MTLLEVATIHQFHPPLDCATTMPMRIQELSLSSLEMAEKKLKMKKKKKKNFVLVLFVQFQQRKNEQHRCVDIVSFEGEGVECSGQNI
jgi:hypothetical protein